MVRRGLLLLGLLTLGAAPAAARSQPPRFVPVGAASAMPRGLADLCRSQPAVCTALGGDPALPPGDDTDAERMRLLKRIDFAINARVRQQSDRSLYGVGEMWRPSGSGRNAAGDCEDLAIQKRLDLIAAGFDPARLFFAIVYRTDIGLHTVLVARLDAGDVVLDSRSNFIEPWASTRYSWLVAEYPGHPLQWYGANG